MFGREALDLVVVQHIVLLAHAVLDSVEPFAGLVWLGPVGQVAACVQRHAKDRIAWLEKRLEHALVRLRARVRLDVCKAAIKKLARPLNCEVFSNVDVFAAAIIPAARITFGVFVGHHTALGFHYGGRDDVF